MHACMCYMSPRPPSTWSANSSEAVLRWGGADWELALQNGLESTRGACTDRGHLSPTAFVIRSQRSSASTWIAPPPPNFYFTSQYLSYARCTSSMLAYSFVVLFVCQLIACQLIVCQLYCQHTSLQFCIACTSSILAYRFEQMFAIRSQGEGWRHLPLASSILASTSSMLVYFQYASCISSVLASILPYTAVLSSILAVTLVCQLILLLSSTAARRARSRSPERAQLLARARSRSPERTKSEKRRLATQRGRERERERQRDNQTW